MKIKRILTNGRIYHYVNGCSFTSLKAAQKDVKLSKKIRL